MSLDASGEHAIANTPTPALASGAQETSGQAPASQAPSCEPHGGVLSSHGGHIGKLQESLTRSAAFQVPPTPTSAATSAAQLAGEGSRMLEEEEEEERDVAAADAEFEQKKCKHGRLGMLSESLNASLGLQLPPTPQPAAASSLGQSSEAGACAPDVTSADSRQSAAAPGHPYLSCIQKLLEGNERKRAMDCVKLLVKYFANVLQNPHEEKYRRIPVTNHAFKTRVGSCAGSREVMLAAGWQERQGSWQMPGDFNRLQLSLASDSLRHALAAKVRLRL